MKLVLYLIFIIFFLSSPYLYAQRGFNFSKVTPDDFNIKSNLIDSNTEAITIADVGKSEITSKSQEESFILQFNEHKRIQILKSTAFHLATVEIYLYTNKGDDEKLFKLNASAFNVENGSVIETPVNASSVFTEQKSKHWIVKKFTFPSLKPGSIIEYEYTILSDYFFNLRPWDFQDKYPCLLSEYSTSIPEFYRYFNFPQGEQLFTADTITQSSKFFSFRSPTTIEPGLGVGRFEKGEKYSVMATLFTHTWVAKNLPAIKEEPYTFTTKNNVLRVEFQLASIKFSDNYPEQVLGDWATLNKELLLSDEFGADLKHSNAWLDEVLDTIISKSNTEEEKARKIFSYVRDHFTCTNPDDFFLTHLLKDAYKKQYGTVGDINLLLVAFLKRAKINAVPVLLSTTDNGYVNNIYPIIQKYNYVIALAEINGKQFYLDASDKYNGFNKLPKKCYNGYARIIDEIPSSILLSTDSLEEMKISQAGIEINNDSLAGLINISLGYYESVELRKQLSAMKKEDLIKKFIAEDSIANLEISDYQIRDIENVDKPVQIILQFKLQEYGEDSIMYFNPVLQPFYKKNPFVFDIRDNPIEFPYLLNTIYLFQMQIPENYTIIEMPKSERFLLNNDEGMFEYILEKNNQTLQMRCRLKLNKSVFEPDDYNVLRDFFTNLINKQSQMIVLGKKKN